MKRHLLVKFTALIIGTFTGWASAGCAQNPNSSAATAQASPKPARIAAKGLPQRPIIAAPGGPLTAPVPGTGTHWPTIGTQSLAGKWALTSTKFGTAGYELVLHPAHADTNIGRVEFVGASPFKNAAARYWRYDTSGHIFLMDENHQTLWRASRFGPNYFQAGLAGPTIYALTPL